MFWGCLLDQAGKPGFAKTLEFAKNGFLEHSGLSPGSSSSRS